MPKVTYTEKKFREISLVLIGQANAIIDEYGRQGFSLTLRQLYYQMVARDIIPNDQQSYKRLGSTVVNARLAGLIDWYAIEDRTRFLRGNRHWTSPIDAMDSAIQNYRIDKWIDQLHRAEVWIEKDALIGVIAGICRELDIDYFSCRGYTSISEMWRAGRRLARYIQNGQAPIVLHFGDHDPSGIDMTRDIFERLAMFSECKVTVSRLALNMDQIEVYNPPPNPAKLSDSRAGGYIAVYGRDSWELDALEPSVIVDLIHSEVHAVRDEDLWGEMVELEEEGRSALQTARESMVT